MMRYLKPTTGLLCMYVILNGANDENGIADLFQDVK